VASSQNPTSSPWKQVFSEWPADVPRRGVLVTTHAEQIPFDGFAVGPEFLFLDRTTPDTIGGRQILLTYDQLALLKFTDVIKAKSLGQLGLIVPPGGK